jgi:hypothetical protein
MTFVASREMTPQEISKLAYHYTRHRRGNQGAALGGTVVPVGVAKLGGIFVHNAQD